MRHILGRNLICFFSVAIARSNEFRCVSLQAAPLVSKALRAGCIELSSHLRRDQADILNLIASVDRQVYGSWGYCNRDREYGSRNTVSITALLVFTARGAQLAPAGAALCHARPAGAVLHHPDRVRYGGDREEYGSPGYCSHLHYVQSHISGCRTRAKCT